jgi:hypothetical protein
MRPLLAVIILASMTAVAAAQQAFMPIVVLKANPQ